MKKLIAIPVIAVVAAFAAASASGFANGVSSAPIQSGDVTNLTCAGSARVVEWGHDDSTNPPNVSNALVMLSDSTCQGQAVSLIALKPDGTELARFGSERLSPTLASGTQYIRLTYKFNSVYGMTSTKGVATADLNAIRISVDGGYPGMVPSGSNTNP